MALLPAVTQKYIRRNHPSGKSTGKVTTIKLITPRYNVMDSRFKIALVQPGSWGDNINSTLMFKPIKDKWPNCILDVYTSTIFASAFANNPYITTLIQAKAETKDQALHLVNVIPNQLNGHGYDVILNPHPMIHPDKWTSTLNSLGTNLILAWVRCMEDLGVPYTLPLQTVLRLTPQEVANVDNFFRPPPGRNVLMETETRSGQSFWNADWTMATAKYLLNGNTNLYISRQKSDWDVQQLQEHAPGRVFFAGNLSIRECAELYNRCDIFFSVSSGLSNACNTNWCKTDKKWVETINSDAVSSAPIRSTGKIFWKENNLENFLKMLRDSSI
jgi:hypothetical protein